MHVTVMLAELCRICWLNHETEHQLRDKTINFNVIEVLCARCHHRLTKYKLISKSYLKQVYILFTFSAILILLQCVIKPPPGRCNYLQCGNMYQCDKITYLGYVRNYLGKGQMYTHPHAGHMKAKQVGYICQCCKNDNCIK